MKRAIFISLLMVSPALADVTPASTKAVDCYCTDKQRNRVELGETRCLHVDGRMFIARCQMSLNVPMWREMQEGCLSSSLEQDQQPIQSFGIHAQV